MSNVTVKPGVSGRPAQFNTQEVSIATIANELALLNLGDFEPLRFKVDCGKFRKEIKEFENDWVDYLPRTDRPNNRKGLTLTNLPGKSHKDNPSQAQASVEAGRKVPEVEFCQPTDVYKACTSLHELLDYFGPLGRTFLVRSDIGGHFVPHRDHPSMPRETFRVAVFLHNCGPLQYDWLIDTDRKLAIEHGRAYYINTRKTHRTMSWTNESTHLIMNIPMTNENVSKLIGSLQHPH